MQLLIEFDLFNEVDRNNLLAHILRSLLTLLLYEKDSIQLVAACYQKQHVKEDRRENLNILADIIKKKPIEEVNKIEVEEDENEQNLEDPQIFKSRFIKGFLKLNNLLDSYSYEDKESILTEIKVKLCICEIIQHYLEKWQNFLLENIIIWFK